MKKDHFRFLAPLGGLIVGWLSHIGQFFFFSFDVIFKFTSAPFRARRILFETFQQGVSSLVVIFATSLVTGIVLTLQLVTTLNRFGAESKTSQVLAIALVRELGPVLAALMYIGKAGGRMASELGTMAVNEQIKALRVMAIDPVNYLIVNRVLAGIICVPLLVTLFDVTGITAGGGMMFLQKQMTFIQFLNQTAEAISLRDLVGGWLKALVFGFIVTLVCCFKGFNASGGSAGVGEATTKAVATSSILVIFFNLIITKFNMVFID